MNLNGNEMNILHVRIFDYKDTMTVYMYNKFVQ